MGLPYVRQEWTSEFIVAADRNFKAELFRYDLGRLLPEPQQGIGWLVKQFTIATGGTTFSFPQYDHLDHLFVKNLDPIGGNYISTTWLYDAGGEIEYVLRILAQDWIKVSNISTGNTKFTANTDSVKILLIGIGPYA